MIPGIDSGGGSMSLQGGAASADGDVSSKFGAKFGNNYNGMAVPWWGWLAVGVVALFALYQWKK
ncbi:MAG: hypothetical protein IBX55_15930 [Methyloprofundus sp.]|nr:hypothetical protein [Methyloprofundus sp.]